MTRGATNPPLKTHCQSSYLRAGELQYFRIRPELWLPALEHLRAAEFNAISTYIPWIIHEPREGTFDFTGAT